MMTCLLALVFAAVDPWSGLERHPAVVNSVTAEKSGYCISLRGEWQFTARPGLKASTRAWHDPEEWKRTGIRMIRVPGCWEAQGVGDAGMSRPWAVDWDSAVVPMNHVFNGRGWYLKKVVIPDGWKGRRVWLKIGGVSSEGIFTVNRREVARVNTYCGALKYDITPFVRFGAENEIFAEICNTVASRRGGSLHAHHWGGFWRDVELEATPMDVWIDDCWVRGDFDSMSARVETVLGGDTNGVKVVVAMPGKMLPWSPEHPNLYTAKVDLVSADGRVLETRHERFGIRRIERRGDSLYLNGHPLFLRGAGYHHYYPVTGVPDVADTAELRRRVRKIREAGFNIVRFHTRCEVPEFFEICDEEGLMVEPELPYYHSMHGDGMAFDPYADFMELYENFRRYPSMVIYSLGNEGDFGEVGSRELVKFVRETDPDRLVVLQDGVRNFLSAEYTDFGEGPRTPWPRGSRHPELPFFAHEYLNLCVKLDYRTAGAFTGALAAPITPGSRTAFLRKFGLDAAFGDRLQNAQNDLQKYWIKYGLELARADPYCDGYSYWALQDCCVPQRGTFSGQAMFDPFFDDKVCGFAAAEVAVFNSPSAVLLDTETGPRLFDSDPRWQCGRYAPWTEGTNRIYTVGEAMPVKFLFARFEDAAAANAKLEWELRSGGKALKSGERAIGTLEAGPARKIFDEPIPAPDVSAAQRLELFAKVSFDGGAVSNSWPVYVFPREKDEIADPRRALAAVGAKLVEYDGVDYYRELAEGTNDVVSVAGMDGKPRICPGWWWMGPQVGTVFGNHPILKYLPHEPYLALLHMRMIKEGVRLPLACFTKDDLVVYGEGVDACYVNLAVRTLADGRRHVFVYGLDIFSENPESRALLKGIVEFLKS